MLIIGVDPGPIESAICGWDGSIPFYPKYDFNDDICDDLTGLHLGNPSPITKELSFLAIERPVCQKYSGVSVSDTAIIAGRFWGVWGNENIHLITRSKIRWHVGKTRKTNDSVVRARLIDRIHPDYNRHHNPGVLLGVTGDIWQALAAAVTCYDLIEKGELDGYKESRI